MEREDPIRPTLALDYCFGRRTTQSLQKLVAHFWELGCFEESQKLMEIPFRSRKDISIVLVVDLSNTEELWSTIEVIAQLRKIVLSYSNGNDSAILEVAALRLGGSYNDLATLDVFPIPIVIIGTKYDVFQNFDPEVKKATCTALRSVAHLIGGSLLFYSSKITIHTKVLRDVLNSLAFDTNTRPIRTTTTDYMGPILMGCGQDSWEKIGRGPSSFMEIGSNFKRTLNLSSIGNIVQKEVLPQDPAEADFREPVIDEMRAQKDQEILSFLRNEDIRVKFMNIVE